MRAYVETLPYRTPVTRSDALITSSANGANARRHYIAKASGIELAGWLPGGNGVVFWLDPMHSASLAADGLPLMALRFGDVPQQLTTTLPYREWLAWDASRQRLFAVAGGPRTAWHGKRLMRCSTVARSCSTVFAQAGKVTLDPALSPDESRVAFVRARDLGNAWGFSKDAALAGWIATRTLWVGNGDGSRARRLDNSGSGVYRPAWSGDGRRLLYVRSNALWSFRPGDAAPIRVLGPFPNPPDAMGEYGHIPWSAVFAWSAR